ncbi:amino acid adenylation domain-containing protein [Rhizobium sp. RCC_161_2]|uniref:amino acid adenylation domain-containing protein n=1 Tax=Rhizobium sp. RCC_161_2 TaxID=3239219 RepID=UPI0035257CC6
MVMEKQFYITGDHPLLKHHNVYGQRVLSGLAYIDFIYQFFREKGFLHTQLELRKLVIYAPLRVGGRESIQLTIGCIENGVGGWRIRIEGRSRGKGERPAGEPKIYVTAEMHRCQPISFQTRLDIDSVRSRAKTQTSLEDVYRRLSERELVHSGLMKASGVIYGHDAEQVVQVSLPTAVPAYADEFMFHPTLVDGGAVGALSSFPALGDDEDRLFLPLVYDSFRASECFSDMCFVRVTNDSVSRNSELLSMDLTFFNQAGLKVAELNRFAVKLVRDAGFIDPERQSKTDTGPKDNREKISVGTHFPAVNVAQQSVKEAVASVLGGATDDIDPAVSFYDMGLNSSGLLHVVSALEERLSTQLSPTLLFEYTNVAALSEHLLEAGFDRFELPPSSPSSGPSEPTASEGVRSPGVPASQDLTDIAIIGMSGRYPGAKNLREFWSNLKAGKHTVSTIPETRWDWQLLEGLRSVSGRQMSKWGGFVDDVDCFDAPFFKISPGEAETMDPQERLFLEASWEALEDAGYTPDNIVVPVGPNRRKAVGVFVGVMHNDYSFIAAEANNQGYPLPISLSLAPIANRVSYFCDFHGPSMAIDTVCSASLTALHLAVDSLRKGESEVALAGGVNLSLHPNKYLSYGLEDMHASDGTCRSFGEGGDGYVSAEGVGAVLLKPLRRAEADGDHIYAVIKGSAVNHTGKANGMHVPSPVAQADVVTQCLEQNGIDPRSISYLEAHGTGTALGDPIEIQGLIKAFGRHTSDRQFCAIGSVKSNIGHAESAAGISGLSKIVLQLHHKTLVPSLHANPVNAYIDLENSPFYLQRETRPWEEPSPSDGGRERCHPRRAGLSAFGATGSNAHVIVEEYVAGPEADRQLKHFDGPVMIVLSARNPDRLRAYAESLLAYLDSEPLYQTYDAERQLLASLAYTLQVGRKAQAERLGFIAESVQALKQMLGVFLTDPDPLADVHRGQVKTGRSSSSPSIKALADEIARWTRDRRYPEILEAWVKGFPVDWETVWGSVKPRRVSLPTYPFARERYWINGQLGGAEARQFENQAGREHRKEMAQPARIAATESKLVSSVIRLPDPDEAGLSGREKVELLLRQVVAEQLNVDIYQVELEERFFDQGLSSAGVVALISALGKGPKIQLSPALLFEYATIATLADYLAAQNADACDRIMLGERQPGIPSDGASPASLQPKGTGPQDTARPPGKLLSEGQKGLWALQRRFAKMNAYNVPVCFRVRHLDIRLFRKACRFLVRQHPILSAVFEASGGTLSHAELPDRELVFHQADLHGYQPEQVRAVLSETAKQAFDLDQGPLFKTFLFSLSDEDTIVLINVHHIVFDGHSILLMMDTLFNAYQALCAGREPELLALSATHDDFVREQNALLTSDEGQTRLAYWKTKLAEPLPALNLPATPARHLQDNPFAGASHTRVLSRELSAQIKRFSETHRIYESTVLLGLFKLLLSRYSGQDDLIVGMPVNERNQGRYHDVIGFLVNMVPVRSHVRAGETFEAFLNALQATMLDGMIHHYPFPALVQALGAGGSAETAPIFQTAFIYQDILKDMARWDHLFQWVDGIRQEGEYELVLEVVEEKERFALHWKYQSGRYDADAIERMADHYVHLAQAVMAAPAIPLDEYSSLSGAEEQVLLRDWNDTAIDYPATKTVDELFEAQVREAPAATALVHGDRSCTYEELSDRVSEIAAWLQAQASHSNARVAICVERSIEMVAGLLGILRAGMTYIPLDPAFPETRLKYILEDSQADIVLTQTALKPKVSQLLNATQAEDAPSKARIIALDEPWPAQQPVAPREVGDPTAPALAYIMYTSGSTGRPKGVMIPHRALTNFLLSVAKAPGMTRDDRLLAVTTYSFDIAGLELFLPLIVGGQCHIADTATVQHAEKLKQLLQQTKPTIMQATPSTWNMLFHAGWRNEEKIKILCGGEALPTSLRQRFHDTDSDLWNLFGPTETTIWSTVKQLKGDEPASIGRPIANTQVYVLDRFNRLNPVGVPGELCIAGDGLALGYWNRPELTAEKFIDNPFGPGTKLYRTGDLARWMSNGELEYLGRIDFQVKLNGFRIELDEIESHLSKHPAVQESVVILQDRGDVKRLIAFYVPARQDRPARQAPDFKAFLKDGLPGYMIPAFFVSLDRMPMTLNGKIDRRALMDRDIHLHKDVQLARPQSRSDLEQALLEIWRSVLGVEGIEAGDTFIELGGNSVSATILADRIAAKFQRPFTVTDLFKYPSVEKISQYFETLTTENGAAVNKAPDAIVSFVSSEQLNAQGDLPEYYQTSLAIIGISCHFPGAQDHRQFWKNLVEGKESVTFLAADEAAQSVSDADILDNPAYVPVALNLEGKDYFDPDFFRISHGNAALMDPQFRQLLLHSWKVIEDAGYTTDAIPRTGVFMSASNNLYNSLSQMGLEQAAVMENAEDYVSWIFAQGGSIPTMISYQLGLKGPSMFVHTNCSSSLSGLYLANQALQSGDVDYALVGGATLFSTFEAGYIHQPGLNFSSDGHCKTFDAKADGMIAGEGIGVIMVKRAVDAVRDNDNIYCLLRGIAINNDGDDKAGFYAPSVTGQASVIQHVLEQTRINPESIRYVEAHGTGTALGDPIEVAALREAFERHTDKRQFCGIGSVKPNIGHLDTVAGLAGCMKLALSLHHQKFPAQINYSHPNPQIDFERSPFYVQQEDAAWSEGDFPARAALSSFGIGGSNAHAILEEYRSRTDPRPGYPAPVLTVIPLSAKNKDRLRAYAQALLTFLQNDEHEKPDLTEVAYTLQVGRKAMESRVAFVVSSVEELIDGLSRFVRDDQNVQGIFQGDMGHKDGVLDLIERDDDAGELIGMWLQKGKLRQLAKIWAKGVPVEWRLLHKGYRPRRVSLPTYQFAQQRYHHKQHVPKALTPLREHALHPLVHRNVSDFYRQQFTSAFHGREFFLAEHVLKGRKILPGVAYLEMTLFAAQASAKRAITSLNDIVWMQPIIVDDGDCRISVNLAPQAEHIRYEVFSEGGDPSAPMIHSQGFLTYEERPDRRIETIDIKAIRAVCGPSLSQPQFYSVLDGLGADYGKSFRVIETVWKDENQALAKLRLPEHRFPDADAYHLHPSIMDAAFQITDSLILQPGETGGYLPFFVKRIDVYQKTPLNGYAHVRFSAGGKPGGTVVKYDIDIVDEAGNVCVSIREFCARKLATADFNVGKAAGQKRLEMLYLSAAWADQPIDVVADSKHEPSDETQIVILAGVDQGVINAADISPRCQVLYLPRAAEDEQDASVLGRNILENFQLCFDLIQQNWGSRLTLLVLAPGGEDACFHSALNGLFTTARQESRKFRGRLVSIERMEGRSSDALAALVRREIGSDFSHVHVHYTADLQRRAKRLVEIAPPASDSAELIRQDGVYWITGGSGKLAMIFAKDLLLQGKRMKIILTGRTTISAEQQQALDALCHDGSLVAYWQADISSPAGARQVFERIKQQFGALNGILHCAGLLRDALIVNKTAHDIQAVFAPKVSGVLALDHVTRDEPLDFIALFSSVSGVFGSIGQADYAAANTFLDAFALYRNSLRKLGKRRGKTVSIDWPLWKEGGMQTDEEHQNAIWDGTGVAPLQTASGVRAFHQALNTEEAQVVVLEGDRTKMKASYLKQEAQLPAQASNLDSRRGPASAPLNAQDMRKLLLTQIKAIAAEQIQMRPAEIDEDKPFGVYGFDSISFTTFSNKLNVLYKLKPGSADAISPTVFFEYNSISSLAAYLLEEHASLLQGLAGEQDGIDGALTTARPDHHEAVTDGHGIAPVTPLPRLSAPYRTRFSDDGVEHTQKREASVEDIAIIGMSGKFPMAEDLDEFWQNLAEGRDCISEIPAERWSWKEFYGNPATEKNKTDRKWGGFIAGSGDFDPLFFGISPKDAELMDPCHRLLMTHVWTAIEDAGYAPASLSGSKTAVFVGVGNSGYADLLASSGAEIGGQTVIGTVSSIAPGRISHLLNLHGPSEPVDTACSSSLVAMHRGVSSIRSGEADIAIVGGVQGMFSPQVHISFSKAGMLAKDGRCKTFSGQADGYVRGEGVGILILKQLSRAEADKDHIYGVIKSTAINHGGRGNTLTSPNPKAQKDLLVAALTQANVDPRTIGYIEAHGTGTPLGDPIEVNSMQEAFKELNAYAAASNGDAARCGIGSVKTNIGHLELAAGVAGVAKVLLQMKHKTLVPSLHCDEVNPLINLQGSPFHIVRETRKWERFTDAEGNEIPLRAGVSSFGFGGVNAHVVLEEYIPAQESAAATPGKEPPVMIVLSAKYQDRLKASAEKLSQVVTRHSAEGVFTHADLVKLACTLQTGRDQMKHRLGFVAYSVDDMKSKLGLLLTEWQNADGIHWGSGSNSVAGTDANPERPLARLYADGDYEAILARWVTGQDIAWKHLYGDDMPPKVSAPTYPFAMERYWVHSSPPPLPPSPSFNSSDQSASSDGDKKRRLRRELEDLLDTISAS